MTVRPAQSGRIASRRRGAGVVGVVTLWLVGSASAGDPPGLKRIHQRVADLDPLSVSLLQLEPDLRQDVGFQHLYIDENDPGRFVRVSGAMYAVSPQTDYYTRRGETYAIVSPGTVFYIGAPPELESTPAAPAARGVSEAIGGEGVGTRAPVRRAAVVTSAPLAVFASEVESSGVSSPGALAPSPGAPTPSAGPAPPVTVAAERGMTNPEFRAARLREIAERLSGW